MTLEEILEDVDLLVANSLATDKKIRFLNEIQKQLYREMTLPIKRTSFQTVSDQTLYDIPNDCKPEDIQRVYVGGEEVPYEPFNANDDSEHWTIADNQIEVFPKRRRSSKVEVYYKPHPVELTELDMTTEPSFPSDYHELLSIGCAIKVAKRSGLYDVGAVLQQEYNALYQSARTLMNGPRKRSVTIHKAWE